MSIVGPRPHMVEHDIYYSVLFDSFLKRHKCNPGLTGWAQINGRDELLISEKVDLDVEYLHSQSLRLDIKIIWITFIKVLKKNGVSH